jgi:hypothetical protein
MGRVAESVHDQLVETLQQGNRGFRHFAEIREIRGAAKAKTQDINVTMNQRDWRNRGPKQLNWAS